MIEVIKLSLKKNENYSVSYRITMLNLENLRRAKDQEDNDRAIAVKNLRELLEKRLKILENLKDLEHKKHLKLAEIKGGAENVYEARRRRFSNLRSRTLEIYKDKESPLGSSLIPS